MMDLHVDSSSDPTAAIADAVVLHALRVSQAGAERVQQAQARVRDTGMRALYAGLESVALQQRAVSVRVARECGLVRRTQDLVEREAAGVAAELDEYAGRVGAFCGGEGGGGDVVGGVVARMVDEADAGVARAGRSLRRAASAGRGMAAARGAGGVAGGVGVRAGDVSRAAGGVSERGMEGVEGVAGDVNGVGVRAGSVEGYVNRSVGRMGDAVAGAGARVEVSVGGAEGGAGGAAEAAGVGAGMVRVRYVAEHGVFSVADGCGEVRGVSISGRHVAVGCHSSSERVRVWDWVKGEEVRRLGEHTGAVNDVAWRGELLASCSHDRRAIVWNGMNGSRLRVHAGHNMYCLGVSWGSGGKLATSDIGHVRVWSENGTLVHVLRQGDGSAYCHGVAWHGDYVASGCNDGKVRVWHGVNGSLLRTLAGHTSSVKRVVWSSGGMLASASNDKSVRVWLWENGTEVMRLDTSDMAFGVGWHEDVVVGGSKDGKVYVWSSRDGTVQQTLDVHSAGFAVRNIAWRSDGGVFASCSDDGSFSVWRSGHLVAGVADGLDGAGMVMRLS